MDEIVLDLFDAIGEDFFGMGITAKSVSALLDEAPNAKTIVVRINSPGGSVFEGNAIFSLLRAHGGTVNVEIHGLAASMAGVIAMAGDTITMADNALLMIHNPQAFAAGEAEDMRDTAELLDKVKSTLVGIYAKASGKTRGQISKLMNAETWLTAKEAKAEGFVDKVTSAFGETKETTAEANARIVALLDRFENTPRQLVASYTPGRTPEGSAPTHHGARRQEQPRPKVTKMDRAQLLALFGLSENATDEEIRACAETRSTPVEATIQTAADMVPRADYDLVQTKLAMLKAETEATAKADFETACTIAVDAACKESRIAPSSRDYHLTTAQSSPEALAAFQKFAAAATPIISNKQMEGRTDENTGTKVSGLSPEEKLVCRKLGITPEQYRATQTAMQEDHETYPPEAYISARIEA